MAVVPTALTVRGRQRPSFLASIQRHLSSRRGSLGLWRRWGTVSSSNTSNRTTPAAIAFLLLPRGSRCCLSPVRSSFRQKPRSARPCRRRLRVIGKGRTASSAAWRRHSLCGACWIVTGAGPFLWRKAWGRAVRACYHLHITQRLSV